MKIYSNNELSNNRRNYEAMKREIKLRLGANTKANYQTNKIKKMLPFVQNPQGRKLENIIKLKAELKE